MLSLPLAAAEEMVLSEAETASWVVALYGPPTVLSLILTIRYRQPLLLTVNFFVLLFIVSLGNRLSYPELIGASVVAGACVALLSALGFTGRLAVWVPAPILLDMLFGAIMSFVPGILTLLLPPTFCIMRFLHVTKFYLASVLNPDCRLSSLR